MDIRFDPRLPLVWRDPSTLQIGVDRPAAVLERLSVKQERIVSAIAQGLGRSGVGSLVERTGCTERDVRALVDRLAPALLPTGETEPRGTAPAVEVAGSCVVADEIAALLAESGVGVLRVDSESAGRTAPAVFGVAVSRHVHDPGVSAAWLRRDLPHLQVVVGEVAARVGPVVVPGRTACAHCLDLHRSDLDPGWGVIAGQLWGRAPAPLPRVASAETAARAVRRILVALDPRAPERLPEPVMETVDFATGRVSATESRLHPACGCAAPPGTGWDDDPSALGPAPGGSTTG